MEKCIKKYFLSSKDLNSKNTWLSFLLLTQINVGKQLIPVHCRQSCEPWRKEMVVCQGLVRVLISASQHLKMECVDLCLKEENGRCLFELPVQNLPAGVLAKLDERLQKMEKVVICTLIKLES